MWSKEQMADEVIKFLKPGASVNLGIGLPTLIAERVDPSMDLMVQSENGVLGVAGRPKKGSESPTLINAGKETISIKDGASFFDSSLSFGMIRGGHIDFCILGGMEVDAEGSLANWMIPGKKVTGMGGAMDLVNGAKCVIVMMSHKSKKGDVKLKLNCSLPLTGKSVVNYVVTDMGVFEPAGNGFKIIRKADGVNDDDLNIPVLA